MAEDIVIGIDLGGTMVRVGALDTSGNILVSNQSPIEADRGFEAGIECISGLVEQAIHQSSGGRLRGIGIGATGPVDPVLGTINNPYTLPGWDQVPITQALEQRFQTQVVLENDADAAALGEYWMGAGQKIKRLYAVTVGTGVGTSFILEGKIYRGVGGSHPEGGHHVVDPAGPLCYCGARGCMESLVAGPSIVRFACQKIEAGVPSILLEMVAGDLQKVDARLVFEAADRGDGMAREIVLQAARDFSLGLVNMIALFGPEMIVLSGGVMRRLDWFMPVLQQAVNDCSVINPSRDVQIIPAKLGYYAGMIGAAYTVVQKL